MAGGPMRLWAAATDMAGAPLEGDACTWLVDRREAGHGIDLWVIAPPPGDHEAILIVRSPAGEVRLSTRFVTIGIDAATGTQGATEGSK
jgi:hypothetical protein